MSEITLLDSHRCFAGTQQRYKHFSTCNQCEMTFSVYIPDSINKVHPAPVLYWLSGLTCTDENFVQKAGAQRVASELGLVIVCPDTSPRGDDVPDDPQGQWDFGLGAGFYVNATVLPWSKHYKMYDYVNEELPQLIQAYFPVNEKKAISGHSMGGHGALVSALNNPDKYVSVSAFAPIVNPTLCPWGIKAFKHYLGADPDRWMAYDSCELLKNTTQSLPMLIDQGSEDQFLDEQLKLSALQKVANDTSFEIDINVHDGYDHSYFFIASFIEEHLKFHAKHLK